MKKKRKSKKLQKGRIKEDMMTTHIIQMIIRQGISQIKKDKITKNRQKEEMMTIIQMTITLTTIIQMTMMIKEHPKINLQSEKIKIWEMTIEIKQRIKIAYQMLIQMNLKTESSHLVKRVIL